MTRLASSLIPILMLAASACAAAPKNAAPVLSIPSDWKASEQADLAKQLTEAKPLEVQNLGTAVEGVDDPSDAGACLVPNPDHKTYDIMLWYRKDYMNHTKVYIVDMGTGKVTSQEFPDAEHCSRPEQGFGWWGVLGHDGKFYAANPNWRYYDKGGLMNIYRYDPAENKVELYKTIKGYGGESSPLVVAPDGWIYGSGTWCGEGNTHRMAGAYGFNPETGEVRDFGAIGKVSALTGYGPTIGACDTHLYVACGKNPWALVAINLKTGEKKIILEAPEGGDLMEINSGQHRYNGGAVAWIEEGIAAPRKFYWLYHGQAIYRKGCDIPSGQEDLSKGWAMDDTCPWSKEMQAAGPFMTAAPAPEVYTGQLYPDANKTATLWWRPAGSKGKGKDGWQKIVLENVEKYPLSLHRLEVLPNGLIFGTGDGYKGRFLFDPKTDKVSYLGRGGGSMYGLTVCGTKLYWSGYDCARIFEFDPAKPWNLETGLLPWEGGRINSTDELAFEKSTNPRRVHKVPDVIFQETRVKKMLSGTTAADGRVYFGGKGQRDYEGGGLSWYDPKTGEFGGMWKPFDNIPIGWVTTAHDVTDKDIRTPGRYVVIGTEHGKTFIYDTKVHKLLEDKTFTAIKTADYSGPVLEVAPGKVLGFTSPHGNPNASRELGGVIFGVSLLDGKVFFTKNVPWQVPFDWGQGIGLWDYRTGTDGFIWATLTHEKHGGTGVIVRIDPRDATVHVMGSIKPLGELAFYGRDVYVTGAGEIRRLKDIVPVENAK